MKSFNEYKETIDFHKTGTVLVCTNSTSEAYHKHWHVALEIIMPTTGHFTLECDNTTCFLNEKDIIIISPGTLHSCHASDGKRFLLQVDLSLFSQFAHLDPLSVFSKSCLVINRSNQFASIHSKCVALLEQIWSEQERGEILSDYAIIANLLQLQVLVGRCKANIDPILSTAPSHKQQEYMVKFMQICEYIKVHCTEDLSLETVASIAGFSKYHFSRLFKDYAGETFYSYLTSCRIAHAEELLMLPASNISEVATNSGFNSLSSFLRTFKVEKGCTPSEYKKLQIISHDQ